MDRRKELKQQYKETPLPMGIYQIRNLRSGRAFVGSAMNLPGIINSQRFQLNYGSHRNQELQADWRAMGEEGFAFEVLEELKPKPDPGFNPRKELDAMEERWLEKLQPYGDMGYNVRRTRRRDSGGA